MERSEKYESEKAKAGGPWGGWAGIPRQMNIEVGGSKVLWSRCSICRDVFVCLEAPASGSSSLSSRCRSAEQGDAKKERSQQQRKGRAKQDQERKDQGRGQSTGVPGGYSVAIPAEAHPDKESLMQLKSNSKESTKNSGNQM